MSDSEMAEAMLSTRNPGRPIPSVHIAPCVQITPAVFAQFDKANRNRFDNQDRFPSKDSGIEHDQSPKKTLFPAEPNLGSLLFQ